MKRNPWLAGILNVILFGLGYVYAGRRIVFGILLIFSEILSLGWIVVNPEQIDWQVYKKLPVVISGLLFFFALFYDAYQTVRESREEEVERTEEEKKEIPVL